MKKPLTFGLTLLGLTALGVGARLWQRATAFEPETGLLTRGMPATWLVMATVLLAAVGFFLLSRWMVRDVAFGSYLSAFSLPHGALAVLFVLAGGLMVAGGVRGVLDDQAVRQALREGWGGESPSVPWLVLSIAMFPAGLCAGLVGWLNGRREEGKGRFAWPLLVPGYCACGWLILTYQRRSVHPNVMGYGFLLFGAVCAAIFCYACASFSFEKPRPMPALWLGGMSVVLLAIAGTDLALEGDTLSLLLCLGYGAYVLGQTVCLAWRCGVPAQLTPWTPPDPTQTPETMEVDHHEQ